MISSNWQQLVKAHKVDPVNPAPPHPAKKRKLSHDRTTTTTPPTSTAQNGHTTRHPTSSFSSSASSIPPTPSSSVVASSSSLSSQPTLIVAMDCEMVGIGTDGTQHALARCSIVNSLGVPLYDRYVQPIEPVTDYRTAVSGILPHHILPPTAVTFTTCQHDVAQLLNRRILVGHALHSDLSVLQLTHPRRLVRDTSRWKGLCPQRPRALRVLAAEELGVVVQAGEHDSVEDARTALQLYMKHRKEWELSIKQANKQQHKQQTAAQPGKQQKQQQRDGSSSSGESGEQAQRGQQQLQQQRKRASETSSSSSSSWSSEGPVTNASSAAFQAAAKRTKRP